ncbi:MAG: Hsp20/alpha crystallin family protein [Chloroflexota bacterium]
MPTTITPMRDFVSLREALDKLFEDSFIRPPSLNGGGAAFPIDLYETPDTYVLKASLPGVKPADLSIDATSEIIVIKGEYKEEVEVKDETYLRKERRSGIFHRSFELPLSVDPAKIEATFKDGVLTLTLPKADVVKPKQIQVKTV